MTRLLPANGDLTLLPVREAARRLGLGESTLRHWIADGRVLPVVRLGRRVLVAAADLDALIASARTTPSRAREEVPARERRARR